MYSNSLFFVARWYVGLVPFLFDTKRAIRIQKIYKLKTLSYCVCYFSRIHSRSITVSYIYQGFHPMLNLVQAYTVCRRYHLNLNFKNTSHHNISIMLTTVLKDVFHQIKMNKLNVDTSNCKHINISYSKKLSISTIIANSD